MVERVTLDTNILVDSLDNRDARKHAIALELIAGLTSSTALLTSIALGEFFTVVARKFIPARDARKRLEDFVALFPVANYNQNQLLRAAEEVEAGRFSFWDAVLLASAEAAGCAVCLSEDMADGVRFGKLIVKNPFGTRRLNEEIRAFVHRDR